MKHGVVAYRLWVKASCGWLGCDMSAGYTTVQLTVDGCIMCHCIISSCRSAATSEIVKHCWALV